VKLPDWGAGGRIAGQIGDAGIGEESDHVGGIVAPTVGVEVAVQ